MNIFREGVEGVDERSLLDSAENRTNRDNIRYLIALAVLMLVCELLNETEIFVVDKTVMRIGAACGALLYIAPAVFLSRPLGLFFKSDKIIFRKWYKLFIIAFAWLGTAFACVMLTHHTVIVMAIPIMIMSQYRDTKKLVPMTMALATVCVLLGVYGGYLWGCFDGNLLNLEISDTNATDLSLRLDLLSETRVTDLLFHYALPREIVVMALILLAAKMSSRNNEMLNNQVLLQSAVEKEMQHTNEIQWSIINGMANLIENRDESTGEHVKRTSFYVQCIVDRLICEPVKGCELNEDKAKKIIEAAPLHDIGKISVPDSILRKPGKLTPEEYDIIKLHASEGAKIIHNVLENVEDDDFLCAAAEISGGHHERWDGGGYPAGLSGSEIPLSARIMSVADVFDALVSKRVYKQPIAPEKAFEIIEEGSGTQFDPQIAAVFIQLKPDIISYLNNPKENALN